MADKELLDALRSSASDVLGDLCPVEAVHRFIDSSDAFHRDLWAKAAELGWLILAIPEEHGGMGGGTAELAVLQESLGACVAPIPFLGTTLLTLALSAWPGAGTAERLFPAIMAGEAVGGLADLDGATPLKLTGNRPYRLNGETMLIDGLAADWVVVRVAGDEDSGLALLSTAAPGTSLNARPIADRTRSLARLACENVPIDASQLILGEEAARLLERLRQNAAILVACDALGGADAIFAETVEYLKVRTQFGKPIGSFQALKHRAADLKVKIEMARELVAAAVERATSEDAAIWTSAAKFTACETYVKVASEAVQMHGGIGFTWEHRAHLHLKRATFDRAIFGSNAVHQDRLADALVARAA